ncbi:glycosyltransferase family 2 protein [Nocardioides marmoraquaticus]
MSLPVTAGSSLSLLSLGLLLDNLRRLRVPDAGAAPAAERLAVLLPVRDEAGHVEACLRHLTDALSRWPGEARLLVLDDGSTDGTGALLADHAGIELLQGAPLPDGWLGKPWACHQLAEAADGADLLVFVDADVRVAPHGLTATAALLRSAGLDVVCPYPRQEAHGLVERLVQPLLQWSWLSTLPLGLAEGSTRPSLTAGNGQLLAIDAAAYRRAGGHSAVRAEVLEDLALVRRVKATGGRGGVVDGTEVASCRMYDSPAALRDGWSKSLGAAFGSPAGAVAVGALLVLTHVVPAVAAARGSRVGLLGYAASAAARALSGHRTGGRVVPDALLHPASVVALQALAVDSLVRRRRGTVTWKGRPVRVA